MKKDLLTLRDLTLDDLHGIFELAAKLKDLGEDTAYEQIMLAVSDFEKGNMRLSTVLAAME